MKSWNIALPFVLLASLASACSGQVSEGDSETHWVACKTAEDCSGAQVCQAERCVEPSASGAGGGGGSPTASSGGSPAAGGRGAQAQDPAWACLGQPSTTDDGTDASVDFLLRDLLNETITDARALLCAKVDPDCDTPVDGASSDDGGRVTLNVPGSFDGFARFTTATEWPTYYGFARSSFSGEGDKAVQMTTPSLVTSIASAVGAPQIDGTGFALISVRDCTGRPAKGVRFETEEDGTSTPFYAIRALPNGDAIETDDTGFGGFMNVSPRATTVHALLNDGTGRRVGAISFFVKADSLTAVSIGPNEQ